MSSRTDALLLDRLIAGEADAHEAPVELRALAVLASALSTSAAAPAPEFRTALRATLVADAREQSSRVPFVQRLREGADQRLARWRYNARVGLASAVAATMVSATAVAAATDRSIPGDAFYGLKSTLEDVGVALAGEGAARGGALVGLLDTRMEEVARAVSREDQVAAAAVLRTADTDLRSGAQVILGAYLDSADTVLLISLHDTAAHASAQLAPLRPQLLGDAAAAAADLQTSLDRVTARAQVLLGGSCTGCEEGVHDDPQAADTVANGGGGRRHTAAPGHQHRHHRHPGAERAVRGLPVHPVVPAARRRRAGAARDADRRPDRRTAPGAHPAAERRRSAAR